MLPIDLPNVPLYKDETGALVTIPQVALDTVMGKYSGKTFTDDTRTGTHSAFRILKLPPYLVLVFKRFVKNEFFVEKNNTLVTFQLNDIDLSSCKVGVKAVDVVSKEAGKSYKYSVIAQVVHDGKPDSGTYKAQVLQKVSGNWFEIQDLSVIPIESQTVTLSESYMLLLEMQ